MPNEPFAGVPDPADDPGDFDHQPDEFDQASIAMMLEQITALSSTHYEYLPLFIQSGLLSVIQHRFMMDDDFTWLPDDPENSRILITKEWNRGTVTNRDRRPLICVAFRRAQAQTFGTRDAATHSGVNEVRNDKRALQDTLIYQIEVLDHNPARSVLIAQRVRAALIASRYNMQQFFKLQFVGYPDLAGPVEVEEYDDLMQCTMNMEILTVPVFRVTEDPLIIKKILFLIRANVGDVLGAIQQSIQVIPEG